MCGRRSDVRGGGETGVLWGQGRQARFSAVSGGGSGEGAGSGRSFSEKKVTRARLLPRRLPHNKVKYSRIKPPNPYIFWAAAGNVFRHLPSAAPSPCIDAAAAAASIIPKKTAAPIGKYRRASGFQFSVYSRIKVYDDKETSM